MYQADSREAIHLACDDAPTDRCFCVRLELRALREAVPAFIEVVSWPAPLRTNPAEAGLAEPFGLLAPAPHAVEDVEGVPYHWTGAAENAPVLEDSAPRRQFRKIWRGALSSNEGSKTVRGGRSHTQVKRSAELEPQWLRTSRLRNKGTKERMT